MRPHTITPSPAITARKPDSPFIGRVNEARKITAARVIIAARLSRAQAITSLYRSATRPNQALNRSSRRVIHAFRASGTCGSAQ